MNPMTPEPYLVKRVRREMPDVFTLELTSPASSDMESLPFMPGQFNMLYAFGVGEVPISISGDPVRPTSLVHTVRSVGAVTKAISALKPGSMIGLRGPFGSGWPLEEAEGNDVVVVAGGLGLAPLRPAIYRLLADREKFGKITLLYGARTPQDILYFKEIQRWRSRFDLAVDVTVDLATEDWHGHVGVVTRLISRASFDPLNTLSLVCGPEVMMRYTVLELENQGLSPDQIYLSVERNMKCAIGFCGHCQLGPSFICQDGPVLRYDRLEPFFSKREV